MPTSFTYVQKNLDLRLNKTLVDRLVSVIRWRVLVDGIELECLLTNTLSDEAARDIGELNDQQSYIGRTDTQAADDQILQLRFRFVAVDIVRVTVTTKADSQVYNHHDYVREESPFTEITFEELNEERLVLSTAALRLIFYCKQVRYALTGIDGQVLFAENNTEKSVYFGYLSAPLGHSIVDDDIFTNQSFETTPTEDFYGFGEQFTYFNKKGLATEIWNVDPANTASFLSYKNVPFFISTRGYGFLLNTSRKSIFDMGTKTTAAWSVKVQGKMLDYFLLFGANAQSVLQRYYALTGQPTLPPKWSFGLWMSKLNAYSSQQAVLTAAREFRRRKVPVDVLHIDPPWLSQGRTLVCTYQWGEAFPDHKAMLQELEQLHFRLSLWISPYIPIGCAMYEEGIDKGYFVQDKQGSTIVNQGPMNWWSVPFVYIDFTNPATERWYKEKIKLILQDGPIILKTDLGELGADEALYHNGMDGKEGHNFYTLEYQRIVFEATQEVHREDAMIWCRSGYIGSQKYPVHWAGDVKCNYDNMAGQLRAMLGAGMSGFPFFSHDIGGFVGDPTPDLFLRWFQLGMFSSHARVHGSARRQPWDYSEEIAECATSYLKLRYSLLPHIYSTAVECCMTGEPVCRALVLDYADDPTVRNLDDEYIFCHDILVAPMFQERGERKIYLPEGTWIDFWSQEVCEGGRWIARYYPLERLPLFVKGGSILLKTDPGEFIDSQKTWDQLTLEIYPGPGGKKIVHQDAHHTGSIQVQVKNDGIYVTTENIISSLTIRLIGEHKKCFLNGYYIEIL